jgi:hypothetical protein
MGSISTTRRRYYPETKTMLVLTEENGPVTMVIHLKPTQ